MVLEVCDKSPALVVSSAAEPVSLSQGIVTHMWQPMPANNWRWFGVTSTSRFQIVVRSHDRWARVTMAIGCGWLHWSHALLLS